MIAAEDNGDDDEDDDDDDDDDIIPARKTPVSQRTARSRLSSATPGSSTRPRLSLTSKRPRGRPPLNLQQGDASDPAAASRANAGAKSKSTRAKPPDTTRIQLDPPVPEAPMGGLELLGSNTADAPATSAPNPQPEAVRQPPQEKRRGKERQTESMAAQQAQGQEATTTPTATTQASRASRAPRVPPPPPPPAEVAEAAEAVEAADTAEDIREEHEIEKLLKHRITSDREGIVELLVQWVGEGEQDATWEAEEEIQQGAEEALYEYWKAQGGRVNALFHKPKNPPTEVYRVFKILRHEKKNRGGFQFEVQWVGHAATHGETTVEAESKLKSIAPEMLQQYWESVGGRAKYLAPRGRAKKMRTE
ncbi:hypothetical protein F5Y14DRAFT_310686 [Nemania sp. NC0429]|nr:hypothetical protein F5Y14DRAFT_310686 [Nemania sp. NC0429]